MDAFTGAGGGAAAVVGGADAAGAGPRAQAGRMDRMAMAAECRNPPGSAVMTASGGWVLRGKTEKSRDSTSLM
jgi:hypothetical protein